MRIVADSSPLITLAKISQLEILPRLYNAILITLTTPWVGEVAGTGAGPAGAAEITTAKWIGVHSLKDTARLAGAQRELALGIGKVSASLWTIAMAAERFGVLEEAFRLKPIPDLRAAEIR